MGKVGELDFLFAVEAWDYECAEAANKLSTLNLLDELLTSLDGLSSRHKIIN